MNSQFFVEWDEYSLFFDGCELIEVNHNPYSDSMKHGDDWFINISNEKVCIYFEARYVTREMYTTIKLMDVIVDRTKVYTLEEVDFPSGVHYVTYNDD